MKPGKTYASLWSFLSNCHIVPIWLKEIFNLLSALHFSARQLLVKCLELLDKDKFPHIATSAHYMLSDIYIPDDIDPSSVTAEDYQSTDKDKSREPSASSSQPTLRKFDKKRKLSCTATTSSTPSTAMVAIQVIVIWHNSLYFFFKLNLLIFWTYGPIKRNIKKGKPIWRVKLREPSNFINIDFLGSYVWWRQESKIFQEYRRRR